MAKDVRPRGSGEGLTPSARFAKSYARTGPGGELKTISLRLSEDLLTELAAVGNTEGLSLSDTIRLLIRRGITATEGSKRLSEVAPTIEGLQNLVAALDAPTYNAIMSNNLNTTTTNPKENK